MLVDILLAGKASGSGSQILHNLIRQHVFFLRNSVKYSPHTCDKQIHRHYCHSNDFLRTMQMWMSVLYCFPSKFHNHLRSKYHNLLLFSTSSLAVTFLCRRSTNESHSRFVNDYSCRHILHRFLGVHVLI